MLEHIVLYENFDVEKFMENPEEFFHNDQSSEIEIGDYINSYRGSGQVVNIGPMYLEVKLFDGASSTVKVPKDMAKKITKKEALDLSKDLPNTKRELEQMSQEILNYLDSVIEIEDGKDVIKGNVESAVKFLEDLLVDVIMLSNKDGYTSYYPEFANVISGVAGIAHSIYDSTNDDSLKTKVDKILDKFYELSD